MEMPWPDLVLKLVMIWGISATPQQRRLMSPKPNEISSLVLQRQSLKYLSTQPMMHAFSSSTQYDIVFCAATLISLSPFWIQLTTKIK